jgi:hypothetical protein
MSAAVEERPCKRNGCRNNLSEDVVPQARYCGTEDCDRERAAERKALQFAREDNGFTRVLLELEEGPKRRTSQAEGEHGASAHSITQLPRNDPSEAEDYHSAGELWLRGKVNEAEKEAHKRTREALVEAEKKWAGGEPWDGLKPSPTRRYWRLTVGKVVKLDNVTLSPEQDRCDSVIRANRGLV